MLPDKTFKFKGEKLSGSKVFKERITVLVAANMTGSIKRKLLVIGKSRSPRCFKNVKSLPVNYVAQKKAWMTSELFTTWLREWDQELKRLKKKILLLVDNCPAHPNVLNLSNINLCFFPANTTSVLQPLDQGVIKSLKVHFRKFLVLKMLQQYDENNADGEFKWTVTLLDAVAMISKAWDKVTQKTIANCFTHSGLGVNISTEDDPNYDEEDEIPLAQLIKENSNIEQILSTDQWEEFLHIDDHLPTSDLPNDEDICEGLFPQNHEEAEGDDQEENEVEEFHPPTIQQAITATKTLRNFVCFGNGDQTLLNQIFYLENKLEFEFLKSFKLKQTKITEFFSTK